jgi:hypothetical protein
VTEVLREGRAYKENSELSFVGNDGRGAQSQAEPHAHVRLESAFPGSDVANASKTPDHIPLSEFPEETPHSQPATVGGRGYPLQIVKRGPAGKPTFAKRHEFQGMAEKLEGEA